MDGQLDHVTVAFPDQYNRLWATTVSSEHFVATAQEGSFTFAHNPFNKDIQGNSIDMPDALSFPEEVNLKADLSTLRHSCLSKTGAFVLGDPLEMDFTPRNLLKTKL